MENFSFTSKGMDDDFQLLLSNWKPDDNLDVCYKISQKFMSADYFYGVVIEINETGKFIEIYQKKGRQEIKDFVKDFPTITFVFYDMDAPLINEFLETNMLNYL